MGTSSRKAAAAGSGANGYGEYDFIVLGNRGATGSDYWKGQLRLDIGNGYKHATISRMRLYMYRMGRYEMMSAGAPAEILNQQSVSTIDVKVQVTESPTYYANAAEGDAQAIAYKNVSEVWTGSVPMDIGTWAYFDLTDLKNAIANHPGAYLNLRNASSFGGAFAGISDATKCPYLEIVYSESDATDFSVSGAFYEPIELTRKIPVEFTPSGGVYADLKFSSLSSDYMTVDEDGNATCHEYGFFTAQVTMTPMNGSTPITKNVVVSCLEGLTVMYGVDGEYKECEVFYGQDGEWKPCRLYYGRNGEWVAHDRREPQIVILPSYA